MGAIAARPAGIRAGVPIAAGLGLLAATIAAGVFGALAGEATSTGPSAIAGIPAEYLAAYEESGRRFELGPDGWSYLAGIGKVESDHGRSTAQGVHSGQNTYGCCAGPMQIHNGFGSGGGTWGAFRTDGDGDGRRDIYDPEDAIATAARYLGASGAPGDWPSAIFAYNHSGAYVAEIERYAQEYRHEAATRTEIQPVAADGGAWLAPVPGFPGERCDRRIIPDVVLLIRSYGLTLNDCFGTGHELHGEHPLGLATDLVPSDGDWSRTLGLARAAGWSPTCAAAGCPGRGPFRVVLYNGYPGHGDPAHTSTPHLHLSWQHSPAPPFTRAREVFVLTASGGAP
jgi:hypothetical protein